jgi:hypothetical protein
MIPLHIHFFLVGIAFITDVRNIPSTYSSGSIVCSNAFRCCLVAFDENAIAVVVVASWWRQYLFVVFPVVDIVSRQIQLMERK